MLYIITLVYKYLNQIKTYDFATYLHCCRVARISVFIGCELSINQSVLDALQQAALLHDLGKVNISRGILNCTDKLTNHQWDIIRQHPIDGAGILQSEKEINGNIIDGVLAHHEHWNGKGYPYGLAGEEIPLLGRIIAIADSLDAMLSSRPYRRKPLLIDEAVGEVLCHAGQQFDPHIINSLKRSFLIGLRCDVKGGIFCL